MVKQIESLKALQDELQSEENKDKLIVMDFFAT